jgi:hypothetical protein
MHNIFIFFVGWFLMLTLPFHALSQQDYPNHRQLSERAQQLARSNQRLVSLESLTKTAGGKDIWLLSIGTGDLAQRPAIAIVGGVSGDHLLGSELALQFAEKLVADAANNAEVRALLDSVTFYVFPDMSPDAREQYVASLRYERLGNAKPSDLDRDGKVGEDPYNDLNGDGLITLMRVKDPNGSWMKLPEDERILVRAQPEKGQRGEYQVHSEGIDMDKDGQFNEDGEEGVFFNKNFTFKYPAFTRGAGEHAVSENETRAIADFLFAAKNVFAVVSFGPANNLSEPLRYNEREAAGRIPTAWQENDIKMNQLVSMAYNKSLKATGDNDLSAGGKAIPGGDGDFFQWAYFHYGRYSFSTPGWWVPPAADKGRAETGERADPGSPATPTPGAAAPQTPAVGRTETAAAMRRPGGPQGSATGTQQQTAASGKADAEVAFLKWAESQGIDDVFVPWTKIDHPDFPGTEVEVGGIKPHVMISPPYEMVSKITGLHTDFALQLAAMRPQVDILNVKTENLGNNLFRITADITNKGSLPTISQHGQRVRWVQKVVVRLTTATAQELISGKTVEVIDSIEGRSSTECSWLVRGKGRLTIRAGAENTGFKELTITL